MLVRLLRILSITVLVVACAACASARLAKPELDAAAKQFRVPSGESNIYIYRSEDIVLNTAIAVTIDGKPAGNSKQQTSILKTVPPGKYTITAQAENTDTIELVTEAGKNYFIWLEVRIGVITNHAHFHLVDEARGKPGVRISRLIE